MVATRGQHRQEQADLQRALQASMAQQRMRSARRWIKRYKPTDTAHRHRLHDEQDKDVQVTSYRRRS